MTRYRVLGCAVSTISLAALTAACSHGSTATTAGAAGGSTYTIWDPYPQFDNSSDWVKTTSWPEFATGNFAFSENGTWQLANAEKTGFDWGIIPIVFATTLDGGGSQQHITLGIYHYIGNNNQQWNAIMATAVVASIPATLLLVLAHRYVAAGITARAVKD